ncbi:MAG: hypothetical protein JW750_02740, partial [Anaerolineaceae bacterium]|nr:hypothetical protein [Anaerolineaceae bacterium]
MKNGTIKFSVVCYLMWIMALLLVWAIAPSRAVQAAGVRYAKPNAAGAGDCSSWDDACALQTALTGAVSGEQIWVMAGTHVPTTGSDRTAAFQLKSGVAVYGGFAGTETSLSARNPAVNVTILSGEIGALGAADNSYHVVKGGWTDSSAVLDGFTITGGHADDDPSANDGGGMYNFNGSPKLSNLIITGNSAGSGGGIYNEYGRPSLSDVLIVNNSAVIGGGMYNNSCDAALTNVRILLNSASAGWGGGVYNNISSPTFSDVTISGNSAVSGGGMYNSRGNVSLVGVTISGNTATSGSGGGMFNYFSNPTLSNVTISGNFAQTGRGGAMLNMDQSFPALTNVTLNGNIAAIDGGGITNLDDSTVILRNVILWGNTGGHLFNDSTSSAVITNSVVEDGCPSGSACTNLITTNPMLGMLGDHGGETETVPLLAGSSAVDAAIANCPAEDQRGVARSAPNCDIGAYEYSSDNAAPSVVSVSLDSSYVNGPNSFTITFSEALYDPSGDMSSDDVSNPENYLLIESGVDGLFNTVSCAGGWASDDQRVNIAGVAYDNSSFT